MPDDTIGHEAMRIAQDITNLRIPAIEGARRIEQLCERARWADADPDYQKQLREFQSTNNILSAENFAKGAIIAKVREAVAEPNGMRPERRVGDRRRN